MLEELTIIKAKSPEDCGNEERDSYKQTNLIVVETGELRVDNISII